MALKIKTKWHLALFYKSPNDPAIERDVKRIENLHARFAKNHSDGGYLDDDDSLLKTLWEWDKLVGAGAWKPVLYFAYKKSLNSKDNSAAANESRLVARLTKAANQTIFFTNNISKLPEEKQTNLLNERKLKKFHYFLKYLFGRGKHTLSDEEEKILNLKYLPAHHLWVSGQERLLNSKTVFFAGQSLPLSEAMGKVSDLQTTPRRALGQNIVRMLKENSEFAENEINAVYTDKKINDELRGFKRPWHATVLDYQNDLAIVENLVEAVTKHFSISREFYKLKARLLKEKCLTYHDRSAKIGKVPKKYAFAAASKILLKAFGKIHPDFAEIAIRLISNSQVDVYPQKGKAGGAYCSGGVGTPTMLLLNWIGGANSVMTFGHEMGHAIHTEFSKKQIPLYQEYSFTAAEIASTLFENFIFDELTKNFSKKEKIIALHDRLQDKISTIFRQIACFNFEKELHEKVKSEGFVPKEKMAELMNKHMKSYLGTIVDLTDDDGYFFVSWTHLRRFFYVYSYAYGELASNALYQKYKETGSPSAILKFLSAGGNDSVENILAASGINVRNPDFFSDGLKQMRNDLEQLKKLF
ncbi:MAG: PepF/M3 family oligoendopeptidase [Parcubacteria group bacterium GW2011_GWA2_47_21]|nr:MAG: PepF/M3 family oligoendopeptidase [Parcubacteria group bacterium GW2011_GWA2_47_21]